MRRVDSWVKIKKSTVQQTCCKAMCVFVMLRYKIAIDPNLILMLTKATHKHVQFLRDFTQSDCCFRGAEYQRPYRPSNFPTEQEKTFFQRRLYSTDREELKRRLDEILMSEGEMPEHIGRESPEIGERIKLLQSKRHEPGSEEHHLQQTLIRKLVRQLYEELPSEISERANTNESIQKRKDDQEREYQQEQEASLLKYKRQQQEEWESFYLDGPGDSDYTREWKAKQRKAEHARRKAEAEEEAALRAFNSGPTSFLYPPTGPVYPEARIVDEHNYYLPVEELARQYKERLNIERAFYEQNFNLARGGAGHQGGRRRRKTPVQRRKTPVKRRKTPGQRRK